MSRLLIVGSTRFSENPTAEELKRFRELSEELGRVLAARGHELVVCSRSIDTADHCAVSGADQAASADKHVPVSFFVSRAEAETDPDPYGTAAFPNVDRKLRLAHGGWFATYDAAAEYCDAVIAIGGSARGTGGALYIALSRRKPVIGMPAVGGAASDIWRDVEPHYDSLPAEVNLALRSPDSHAAATAAVEAAEYLVRHDPFPPRSPAPVYALFPLVMLAAGAGWVYIALVSTAIPSWRPYLVAVIMAIAGMLLRYATDAARNQEAYFGPAKLFKDAARVLGLVLLASLLIDWGIAQAAGGTIDASVLRTKSLAIIGFAAGFLVEEMSGLLTNTLTAAVRTVVERGK
jgi:hypothetical protein